MTNSRRTVAGTGRVEGVGLHSGAPTAVTFRPAESGTGIIFRRTDLPGTPDIPARTESAVELDRRTGLAIGDVVVQTVEHVLAAVVARQIDDLVIELEGLEPPIGDGSAQPFVDALERAGHKDNGGTPTKYRVRHAFTVQDGDTSYVVAPADGLRLTVTIDWRHPLIGRQSGSYDITPELFAAERARARTFGFLKDAEDLRAKGLSRGVTSENTILLSKDGTQSELRWRDEFVRHKAVDLLGDLALAGGRCEADIVCFRPSHRANLGLVKALRRHATLEAPAMMGIEDILGVLPHRYPLLLVDRILEIERGRRIVGIKNVTFNEPFFQGHFPAHPVMPGVLIVEAMAQAGGMLLMGEVDDPEGKLVYFMGIDNVKFRRPVTPGDQLRLELEMLHFRGRNCRMHGVAYVDGGAVAEAEMTARIVDR
ncbi:MAG: UDP-3-O-acyl-N-acetylglucosamine deacetylase [Gemmatimonadales bacterium]